MSGPNRSLAVLQHWLQTVIMHSEGIEKGINSSNAQTMIPMESPQIQNVINPSQSLSSIERLAIYGNAYYARLIECLGQEFLAVRQTLGAEAFEGFAFQYLQEYPSNSYTLAMLGQHFPQFLRETRPETVEVPDWPDFLIDLATVERIYAEVFDSRGPETADPIKLHNLQGITSANVSQVIVKPFPCVRVAKLQFPVEEYISAVHRDETPDIPAPETTHLVISRKAYVVKRKVVSHPEFIMISQILADKTLQKAIEVVINNCPQLEDEIGSQLRDWFCEWAQENWFEKIQLV